MFINNRINTALCTIFEEHEDYVFSMFEEITPYGAEQLRKEANRMAFDSISCIMQRRSNKRYNLPIERLRIRLG